MQSINNRRTEEVTDLNKKNCNSTVAYTGLNIIYKMPASTIIRRSQAFSTENKDKTKDNSFLVNQPINMRIKFWVRTLIIRCEKLRNLTIWCDKLMTVYISYKDSFSTVMQCYSLY